ncbi:Sodium/hydrogen exchanger [Aphelenchoides fujianensis]|nr:Sodium/hydrogen exchanger [Aphelenchoides fujianensis]
MSAFVLLLGLVVTPAAAFGRYYETDTNQLEVATEKRAQRRHEMDSLIMLVFSGLFVLIVLTSWFFKHHRLRFIHETGLTLTYGLLLGLVLRYTQFGTIESKVFEVNAQNGSAIFVPPDYLRLNVSNAKTNATIHFHYEMVEGYYSDTNDNETHMDRKTVFSPEVFFNILLPPVIFNAGYSLKKRHFFRNIGSIMAFVFIGSTLSSLFVSIIMYVLCALFRLGFGFSELLFFGALISATDPVTVLAVFSEMHVDSELYALVFGESALNDAVAIVLAGIVESYSTSTVAFTMLEIPLAMFDFGYVFCGSFFLGSFIGCTNALITKLPKSPNSRSSKRRSSSSSRTSPSCWPKCWGLTGIVAVLFCGICQAHYTFNNLSAESQMRTKQFFEAISFLSESFIFLYIGVSLPTGRADWSVLFFIAAVIAINAARALFVYPLCALLNIKRRPPIPKNHQHMLVFAGLRGAVPFALASRNTATSHRQIMQSTTSLIVLLTVLVNGGLATWMIERLGIKHGTTTTPLESEYESDGDHLHSSSRRNVSGQNPWDKAFLPRKWYNFDAVFMKPLLTHANPTLMETLPGFCQPLARVLTTQRQLENSTRRHFNPRTLQMDVVAPEQEDKQSPL